MHSFLGIFFTLFLLISITLCQNITEEPNNLEAFQFFILKYNKTYKDFNEFNERLKIFSNNIDKIRIIKDIPLTNNSSLNSTTNLTNTTKQGVSKFSDLTPKEFSNQYLGTDLNMPEIMQEQGNVTESFYDEFKRNQRRFLQAGGQSSSNQTPINFDWRDYGIITPIKDQANCGICWGFSAVANIESQYAMKYQNLHSFSEQFLLNCDISQIGCDGGFMTNAFTFVATTNGIPLMSVLPYTGVRTKCTTVPGYAKLQGYRNAGSDDEEIIKEFLYKYGPVSISMHGNLLQNYNGGIIYATDKTCAPTPMNHACLLIGYGTDPSGYDYWIAKNSWGEDWGENGFFRIVRGYKACGLNLYACSSVVS